MFSSFYAICSVGLATLAAKLQAGVTAHAQPECDCYTIVFFVVFILELLLYCCTAALLYSKREIFAHLTHIITI